MLSKEQPPPTSPNMESSSDSSISLPTLSKAARRSFLLMVPSLSTSISLKHSLYISICSSEKPPLSPLKSVCQTWSWAKVLVYLLAHGCCLDESRLLSKDDPFEVLYGGLHDEKWPPKRKNTQRKAVAWQACIGAFLSCWSTAQACCLLELNISSALMAFAGLSALLRPQNLYQTPLFRFLSMYDSSVTLFIFGFQILKNWSWPLQDENVFWKSGESLQLTLKDVSFVLTWLSIYAILHERCVCSILHT